MVIPRTVKKQKMNPVLNYILENGGLAMSPKMGFPETFILQKGENGKIHLMEIDASTEIHALDVKLMNHRTLVGAIRHGVEQAFAGISQWKILKTPISHDLWNPIGAVLANKLDLDREFSRVSKIQLIVATVVQLFNETHQKFRIKYANEEQQLMIAENIGLRLNYPNCLMDENITYDFSLADKPHTDNGWTGFYLKNLDHMRNTFPVPIPVFSDADVFNDHDQFNTDVMNLTLGPYRWQRACCYITLTTRYLLRDQQFDSREEFLAAIAQRPGDLKIYYRHIAECPDGWSEDVYGVFPNGGLGIVACQLPSANR